MTESEISSMIKREVARQVNVILSGQSAGATESTEDINGLYTGMPALPGRPVMHPFGFCSKAPNGTIQVVARHGDHTGNRIVLGHRDAGRPTDLEDGETAAYSTSGYRIVWQKGAVMIGQGSTLEPLVMGETLNTFLTNLLNLLIAHTHAAPGTPPTNVAQFTNLLTTVLNQNKILVKDGGAF